MIVNETFFKAKKDKDLHALVVAHRLDKGIERTYMYLCIDERSKYDSNKKETIFVETDTTLRINNCSTHVDGNRSGKTNYIAFHCSIYGDSHIQTFLNAIKKNSDVSFYIVAYNGCDNDTEHKIVRHQLYGDIDGSRYLLENYVGPNNTASPVKEFG